VVANQIAIKISQTPHTNSGKTKPTSQSKSSESSFDQVFSAIYSDRQLGHSKEESKAQVAETESNKLDESGTLATENETTTQDSSELAIGILSQDFMKKLNVILKSEELGTLATGNETTTQDSSELAIGNLSPEVMKKLDAILTSLILATQQSPQLFGSLQNQSLVQAVSGAVGSSNEGNASIVSIASVLKGEGTNQTTALNPKQLIDELTQLLNEISQQEEQQLSSLLPNIKGELQKNIDAINNTSVDKPSGTTELNNDSTDTMPLQLSLDKRQVILSNTKEPAEIKITDKPIAIQSEFQIKDEGLAQVIVPNLQGQGEVNGAKSMQPSPTISVSEFAPEVSELIGRYIKISNGESGSTEAKFSLYPEHLGPIEVKIVSQQGHLTAQIFTNTSIAKEALEGQLQHLRDALQQQGIFVQKLDVTQQIPTKIESYQANLSFFQNGSNSSNEQRNHTAPEESSKDSSKQIQNDLEREIFQVTYGAPALKSASSIDFNA
jgi:flagellar hook-length control protein FliK